MTRSATATAALLAAGLLLAGAVATDAAGNTASEKLTVVLR